MNKQIRYAAKKCVDLIPEPSKCTDKQLMKIVRTWNEYLDALCSEDGYVHTYERTSIRVSPWFEEANKRGL